MKPRGLVTLVLFLFIPVAVLGQDREPAPPAVDAEVWELYLDGVELREQDTPTSYRLAANRFEEAVEKDASFSLAYAGLATVYALRGETDQIINKAREAALKALELDSSMPQAHIAMGLIEEIHHYAWDRAADYFRRAIELSPDSREAHREYGWLLIRTGELEEGLLHMEKAHELAPESVLGNDALAVAQFYNGQYADAAEQYQRVLKLDPDYGLAQLMLAQTYVQMGRYEEASEAFQDAATTLGWGFFHSPEAGYLYAVSGQQEGALRILDDLKQRWQNGDASAYDVAVVHAGLGDEEALTWLERAYSVGEIGLDLRVDPKFEYLHGHPRFAALMEKMNLPVP